MFLGLLLSEVLLCNCCKNKKFISWTTMTELSIVLALSLQQLHKVTHDFFLIFTLLVV